MIFENGVKDMQAAAYNGAHTVIEKISISIFEKFDRSNFV
jgi:hypothetical protein